MNSVNKCIKQEEMTYFIKMNQISIEDVSLGTVVYLKIKTNSKTTIREVECYGKITKLTKSYFEVLVYFNSICRLDNWKTSDINKKENSPDKYIIKRAKKSSVEIWIYLPKSRIFHSSSCGTI